MYSSVGERSSSGGVGSCVNNLDDDGRVCISMLRVVVEVEMDGMRRTLSALGMLRIIVLDLEGS